ncbi:MAG TPA: TetR family transcriptional regulator [Bryobacteraceae bacterium]|nr:TetR family transcriptional regulator [Bryobacteraceae bacterium]
MIAKAVDTKTRILDAAEKLFGKNGFDATSLRDITAEADVNLAAVNYHFQSKDSLIDAVIARRIEPVNEKRLKMLESAGPNPNLEQILLAFLAPLLVHHPAPVLDLMGRIMASPDIFVTRMFKVHLAPVVECFSAAIAKAAPELSRTEILWRLHFTAGAMAHTLARTHLLGSLMGLPDPPERQTVLARLVTFTAAGFRAPEDL